MPEKEVVEEKPKIKEVKEAIPKIKLITTDISAPPEEKSLEERAEPANLDTAWATTDELPTATIRPASESVSQSAAEAPTPTPAPPSREQSNEFSVYDTVRRQDAMRSYDPMNAQRPANLLSEREGALQSVRPSFENPDMRQFHNQPSNREYQERLTTDDARVKRKMPWEF